MTGAGKVQWDRLILSALRLGILPEAFWQLSIREWQMLTRGKAKSGFERSDLSRLISAFPDKE